MENTIDMNTYYSVVDDIMRSGMPKLNFLWDCVNDRTIALYYDGVLPEGVSQPFEYMLESGRVEPAYIPAYEVFCSELAMGISRGTDKHEIILRLKMNIFGEEYSFVTITAVFKKDEKNRIKYIYTNIRPFTVSDEREWDILTSFTSDKNPAIIQKRIKELIVQAGGRKKIAFVQFDVERFKLINDNYGAETGDKLLAFISDTLNIVCTDDMPHGRLSADLYMFVMAFDEKSEIVSFIRLLESRISGFMGIEFRMCFGVFILEGMPKESLRRYGDNAGMARQLVKGNALSNIGFYQDKLLNDLHKTQNIEEDMHNALLSNEFVMFLQPKVCISTGRIIGAEALARWNHHSKGMISPAEFVPVFEKNGFIIKLDRFIWESACKHIRQWIDNGIKPVPISVNVSRAYINGMETVNEISALVKKYDIPIDLLQLEITETADSAGVDEAIEMFKENGFTMLMDDFGSGYSSLNMLKKTKFDVLKIDRNFLSEFMESDRGRKIINHTISMSKDIGLDIIAEGVETEAQAEFLNECGCDAAQGFLYSRPIDKDQFDIMMKDINK